MTATGIAFFTFGASAIGTGVVREYARRRLLDLPNDRSSHSRPTPRGGGAAIVVAVLGAAAWLWHGSVLASQLAVAVVGAGGAVAAIGFIDDHRPVTARVRLVVHFAATAWVLYWLGLPNAWGDITGGGIRAWVGLTLLLGAMVWLLNLFNFMDGIDGLAGSEAFFACAGGVISNALLRSPHQVPLLATIVGAASLGFLLWNFPPARIFMGDVGSGFLGMLLGIVGLAEFSGSVNDGAAWLILLAVFISDATVTLVRRWRSGVSVATAHRTHAYQHAARRWDDHRRVTLLVAAVNLLWLLPLAVNVRRGALPPAPGLILAYAPLIVAVWRMGAGVPSAD